MSLNIVIVGVGGQGTLLASRVLGKLGKDLYKDVKVSEVHGMSQRGGSVVTYVRLSDKVDSPIIEYGGADIVLAFEKLEAFRALPYLKKGGRMLLNTQEILPMSVVSGAAQYPANILEELEQKGIIYTAVDALSLAVNAGTSKCVNTVMLGILAKTMDMDPQDWLRIISQCVPPKTVEMNSQAFLLGYNA